MTDHDCGHSDDEHNKLAKEVQARIQAGDITVLIPTQSNDQLNMLLQAAAAEMFIRSADHESFARNWEILDNLVRGTLMVNSVDESAHPVEYQMLKEAQKKWSKATELDKTMSEGTDELRVMFEQHGVAEPKRPDNGQTFPGYL